MRYSITFTVMGLFGSWLAMSTGCMSERAGNQLAETILSQSVMPRLDLGASIAAFQMAKKKWPKDREELSAFVEQSDGKFQPIPYDHIDFTEKPDGSLDVYATSPSRTNRMTLHVNETQMK